MKLGNCREGACGVSGLTWRNALRFAATSKIDEYARGMISGSGSTLFEELGLYYIGPIDGHNMQDLVDVLQGGSPSTQACLLYLMLVTAMHGLQQQLGVHLTWQSANMHQVPTQSSCNSSGLRFQWRVAHLLVFLRKPRRCVLGRSKERRGHTCKTKPAALKQWLWQGQPSKGCSLQPCSRA